MITRILILLVFITLLLGCKKRIDVPKKDTYVFEFYDTIKLNEKYYGKIEMINTFDDTIKVEDKFGKINKVYVNIFKPSKDVIEIKEDECEYFIRKIKGSEEKDEFTEFFVEPKHKGEFIIAGFIDRSVYLKMKKNPKKLRQIEKRYYFKEKVFVK